MKFTKMHGNGNDFIVIDDRNENIKEEKSLAINICKRNYSIGADGILLVRNSDISDVKMIIINSDGSYASMCGNGIRCFAKYVFEKGIVLKNPMLIETGDGIKEAKIIIKEDNSMDIAINMGFPSFKPSDVPVISPNEVILRKISANSKEYYITSLFMGVPHTVVFCDLKQNDILEGRFIENLSIFPQKTNVNFCEILDRKNIIVHTYERGAGVTLACGTGSCASFVAAYRLGYVDEEVVVKLKGGILNIRNSDEGIIMTGPAVYSFVGDIIL